MDAAGVIATEGAVEGELLVKFAPEMENILDTHFATRTVATRSGIPSTDEVLVEPPYKMLIPESSAVMTRSPPTSKHHHTVD